MPRNTHRHSRNSHVRPGVRQMEIVEPLAAPDAYGQPLSGNCSTPDATGPDWQSSFQSIPHDPASPLHTRCRDFSPTVARWIQKEPMAYVEGPNTYVAFGDNPMNGISAHVDPR